MHNEERTESGLGGNNELKTDLNLKCSYLLLVVEKLLGYKNQVTLMLTCFLTPLQQHAYF